MKITDIRQKTTDELRKEIDKIHVEHYNLRFRRVTDVIENPQALRELRRDLARIHTVIREREMGAAAAAVPAPAKAATAPVAAPAPAVAAPAKKHAPAKAAKKPVKRATTKEKAAKKAAKKATKKVSKAGAGKKEK